MMALRQAIKHKISPKISYQWWSTGQAIKHQISPKYHTNGGLTTSYKISNLFQNIIPMVAVRQAIKYQIIPNHHTNGGLTTSYKIL